MKAKKLVGIVLTIVPVLVICVLVSGCGEKATEPENVSSMPPFEQLFIAPGDTVREVPFDSTHITQPGLARLSTNPRWAIVLEARLAVTGWDWRVSRSIGGWAVSDWNYLASDWNAYKVMKLWYGTNASVWSIYYTNAVRYGFYNNYGRAGQCVHFTNLILYRSSTYQKVLPSYASCRIDYGDNAGSRNYTKHFSKVLIGDILRSKKDNGHTGIVSAILAGVPGVSVTAVDMIDCNFVGGSGQEIIGQHVISTSGSDLGDLDNYYAVDVIKLGAK